MIDELLWISRQGWRGHYSAIYDEYQTQSAKVFSYEYQDDSNDTQQPLYEFQVGFPLLWILKAST